MKEIDEAMTDHFGVVYTISPSPLDAKTVWVGTDDGFIWNTTDDGAHWSPSPVVPCAHDTTGRCTPGPPKPSLRATRPDTATGEPVADSET